MTVRSPPWASESWEVSMSMSALGEVWSCFLSLIESWSTIYAKENVLIEMNSATSMCPTPNLNNRLGFVVK